MYKDDLNYNFGRCVRSYYLACLRILRTLAVGGTGVSPETEESTKTEEGSSRCRYLRGGLALSAKAKALPRHAGSFPVLMLLDGTKEKRRHSSRQVKPRGTPLLYIPPENGPSAQLQMFFFWAV